ncbi:hypothetical protein [Mangrovibacterium diazotrophicum]|uniref:Outer membrane protein with beta-barrel domain n=1 Tax=Mangrovibacterium diazotrophicum TaxID=1261403 RepID=A0A419W8N2_9BACT|nr:hypothetical protein [Mangrovibacterium diazotrophicum]RKD91800.1 hypothetical protein BC643_2166 [Mangrovibacterium diazotrophicum]
METLSARTRRLLVRIFLLGFFVVLTQLGYPSDDGTGASSDLGGSAAVSSMSSPRQYHPSYTFWNRYAGALFLSGGYSTEFNYSSPMGAKFVLDYMVADLVSIGAQMSSYRGPSSKGQFYSNYVGARLSYHLLKAKTHRRQNPWNIYVGINGEIAIGPGTRDWHEKHLQADLHLGARYRLGEGKWFAWGEAAINNVSIGLTLSL